MGKRENGRVQLSSKRRPLGANAAGSQQLRLSRLLRCCIGCQR